MIIVLTWSCKMGQRYSFNEEIPPEGWSKYNKPEFIAEIDDTLTSFDILFSIRNSHEYPYRNLFLFVTTTSPAGQFIKDTIEYQLADIKGNWYGSGLGDIHNLSVPYKMNVLFPVSGEYSFRIEHGMRADRLEGIVDVGLIIRESDSR
jgi:gliding motility-associated lipoprotein GldH